MIRSRLRRTTLLVLAMLLTTLLGACSGQSGTKGSVTVLGPWTGAEGDAFKKVLDKFTDETKIQVNYQGTRALSQVLLANVQGGTPPDVAILSSLGELAHYAGSRNLYPLDKVIEQKQQDAYRQSWLLPLNGHIYTVPVKANLKSIFWYNKVRRPVPIPQTWDGLM